MTKRDLKFDQLRVCAIMFVVAHHVLLFGADVCGYLTPFVPDDKGIAGVVLNSVVVTGVNLFVMISGWFGIRRVWKPMVRLVVECAMFGAVALGMSLALWHICPIDHVDGTWNWGRLWQSIKFTNWWFIVHYLMLVLAAPLLEAGMKNIEQRTFERVLVAFLVLNFVFGFAWGYVNANGYNVVNFVMMYLLARYMRLYPNTVANKIIFRHSIPIIIICAGITALIFLADAPSHMPGHSSMAWHYNSPLVVLESMAIFALFARTKHVSRHVALTAPYVLGIYLLQSSPNMVYYRNAVGSWLCGELGFAGIIPTIIVLFVICLAVSVVVTTVFKRLFKAL